MSEPTERPRLAQSYRIHQRGIDVDGEPFPWHVAAEPGPEVQRLPETPDMHILWLPVLVEAYLLPTTARPADTTCRVGDEGGDRGE